jgi:hypothetical protein
MAVLAAEPHLPHSRVLLSMGTAAAEVNITLVVQPAEEVMGAALMGVPMVDQDQELRETAAAAEVVGLAEPMLDRRALLVPRVQH